MDSSEATKKKRKEKRRRHARTYAKADGSKRFADLRRNERSAKRQKSGASSSGASASASGADPVEDTVKELIGMGFDEAAARAAVANAKGQLERSRNPGRGTLRPEPAAAAQPNAAAPERTFNVWTEEQLATLESAAAELGLTEAVNDERWAEVAARVGNGRSASACRHRWGSLQKGAQDAKAEPEAKPGWKAPKPSERATKLFIGNARAAGGDDEVRQFFETAGELTKLQWLSGKADGSCFAWCATAAVAQAALALSGKAVGKKGQLLVQMAHEVSFKAVVPKLKGLRSSGGSSIGAPPEGPIPKGCKGVFLENLSFELDEETLSWWCNDIVSNSEANGGAAGGKVKAVKFLRRPQEAEKKEESEKTASRKVHKHSHAGCAVVEFKQPARVSIEAMVAKHGATLLGRAVAVKLARAEFKKKGSKGKGKGKGKGKAKGKPKGTQGKGKGKSKAAPKKKTKTKGPAKAPAAK